MIGNPSSGLGRRARSALHWARPTAPPSTITLCIATYRRPRQLAALLGDVLRQDRLPDQVVIVDNDADGSAREVVERWCRAQPPFPVVYEIQPIRNIALTRNRTVELAVGDWMAFIDDDERAPPSWLLRLIGAAQRLGASGVLGPVIPVLPARAPAWIRRGHFYNWARMRTGTEIPPNRLRFGNVLLRATLLRNRAGPFDPAYGLTGGEDGDLLARLVLQGARILWCDEAVVQEPVDAARLSLRWLLRRSLRGGQDFARHTLSGCYGRAGARRGTLLMLRALAQLPAALILVPLSWPMGRQHSAYWLIKAAANFGKLSVLFGWRYQEYARAAS